jgi:hypothetical protein
MKTIEITVSPTGETKLESKNFTGADCQLATRNLEIALGCRISETLSAEYFGANTTNQSEVNLRDF